MSDLSGILPELSGEPIRCPRCDSVVETGADRCLMCGESLSETAVPAPVLAPSLPDLPDPSPAEIPDVFESVMREREAPVVFWMTAVFAVVIIVMGALVLRFRGPDIRLALVPTATPIPPTLTLTPTWTPLPIDTRPPTETPLPTAVPSATPTLPSPRPHTVAGGETLIGLALRYRLSVASLAAANGLASDAALLVAQELLIPWPTPTPPLVPVASLVNGESVIADPTGCERYEVRGGDSLSGIAARYDVDFGLFLLVNRLTDESIMQPGDTVCIPEIVYGGSLPPTPGPSPTPSATAVPVGPQLLYPIANAVIEPPDGVVTLQWTAVKTLDEAEWYMVELTDLDAVDSLPQRGFTRDTAFQLPSSWRPPVDETHTFRWRVSIVQVNGRRADGLPIYTYGGESSQDAFFSWLGAIPTSTPSPAPTATPDNAG
ncbi:MAG: LysM peptidoglycan-binding domain-containing protein [Chloroflexi bacterium]|nr:LysM peptidoglycan-binding domain-containing protein [Chloroflexota bacterium]